MWSVITRPLFDLWLSEQDEEIRVKVLAGLSLLEDYGPNLGRPFVDTLQNSKLSNLKELRVQCKRHPVRAFFCFDPERKAIVLCAGDKSGDKQFYKQMIPLAEKEYEEYLTENEA